MTDLAALVERRQENTDTTKVIDRHLIEALWQRRDLPLDLVAVRHRPGAAPPARQPHPRPGLPH
ncbi:hypothetical protein [Nonomuraea sp. SYSU D8015]|uniref:hypothetical protein n=1 Tax=Nonomuraea sp. SYSU D8015 TaxID=2593644 RepID=UPI0016604EC3|nr:hypothetical protein [Nonomuraea sp. SYSU D8015]